MTISLLKLGICAIGLNPLSIKFIPIKRNPKPKIICPIFFNDFFLLNRLNQTPIAIAGSAMFVSLNAISWAVIVVPIFAPMITPTACFKVISPALTNPTTITVVALLL